ncbi:MAG: hypothetical protein ABW100_06140, partial [Candidatus Thiodiazotropha sp. 6PLUC3]
DLLLEGVDRSLVGDLYNRNFYDLYDFNEQYKMLPVQLRSYYRVTQGMQIVKDAAVPAFSWKDLPLSLGGRRNVSEIGDVLKCSESDIRIIPFHQELFVWMVGNHGDLLLINEDGKFYHSQIGYIDDLFEIEESVKYWDNYCSYVFACGVNAGFVFR